MSVRLVVERACDTPGIPPDRVLRHWAKTVLEARRPKTEVHLRIVDEHEMQALNRDYRGKNTPTNVLSFPADLPSSVPLPLLGDIAICASVITAEAIEQHKPLRAHWAHMLVHGLLHLLGYDHEHDHDAAIMEALETDILASLDFAPPYE